MKKILFIFLSLILAFSLTSCNSSVNQKDAEELKTLIQNLDNFEEELTYVRLDWKTSNYSYKKDNKYYESYYLNDNNYEYEYDISNHQLYLNKEMIKDVEYKNIDEFTKAVFALNNIEIITINDYLPLIKYEFLKSDSFMVTTNRGKGYYYFFSTTMNDLINFDKYEFLKNGFSTELKPEEKIKISLLANLKEKKIFPKFSISYGNSVDLISL